MMHPPTLWGMTYIILYWNNQGSYGVHQIEVWTVFMIKHKIYRFFYFLKNNICSANLATNTGKIILLVLLILG